MPIFSQAAAIRFNFNNIFNKTRSTTTQQSSNNFTLKSMSSLIRTAQCLNITRNFVTMPSEAFPALRFAKLSEHAEAPSRGSSKAAGYDLRSAYCYTVQPRSKEIVATDIQVQLPEGCYGRIAPRSGLAAKNGIDVGAGVVDEDYRGNLRVILFNHSDVPFVVNKGDRIAQLICERIYYPQLEEVKSLTDTERGEAGFGSTGTN